MEPEIGRIRLPYCPGLMSDMKPKERLWSYSFTGLCLELCAQRSYRKSADLINTVLHRGDGSCVKARTLADFAESYGSRVEAYLKERTDRILEGRGAVPGADSPKEDAPTFDASMPGAASAGCGIPDPKAAALIAEKVAAINAEREPAAQIKDIARISNVEVSPDGCCYISIDDVGVKRQKDTRKDGGTKESKYVENTVIHIQTDGKCYTLTAVGLDNAFRMLMAFLTENDLIPNRRLLFLADGAVSIKNGIEKHFSSCPYILILDWYHLKKKCKELISSSIKGTIEQKKEFAKGLLRILWAGDADAAIHHLKGIPKSEVKSERWLEELTAYLERKKPQIVCYALRHALGLRISSNRVEKANDMLVAERQKHNGMSWSPGGSGALASISMLLSNGEADQWLRTHSLRFAMLDANVAA